MVADYSFYHGAFLHQLILQYGKAIVIEPCDQHGRPNTYLLNSRIGVLIKHSTKRLSPWTFTFTKDHLSEIHALYEYTKRVYGCFVCGEDGIACVLANDFIPLIGSAESDQAWLRFDRRARQMYRISGSNGELTNKLPRGVSALASEL